MFEQRVLPVFPRTDRAPPGIIVLLLQSQNARHSLDKIAEMFHICSRRPGGETRVSVSVEAPVPLIAARDASVEARREPGRQNSRMRSPFMGSKGTKNNFPGNSQAVG